MNRYYSVDCEFSGLDHTKYDLLSIGIVEVINKNNEFKIDYSRKFYLELKPLHDIFDPESMKIHNLTFANFYNYVS